MDLEEYNDKRQHELSKHKKALEKLELKYAMSHSIAKIGDIVESMFGFVLVEKISSVTLRIGEPICAYSGRRLTMKREFRKDGDRDEVWQNSIINVFPTET